MGAVTYPDLTVATILNEYFVPVQINVDHAHDLVERFQVIWTPNLNVLDTSEDVIYHVEGWLPPSDCAAMLMVGLGHFYLHEKRFEDGVSIFQEVWDKFPHTDFAPEALYYSGVGKYLESHNVSDLSGRWKMLQDHYPQSTWSMRSSL